jgi:hypothetical protein
MILHTRDDREARTMRRYVQIRHTYVVPVPEAAPNDPEWDTICNAAVSIMEGHMTRVNPNILDLQTSWETMPVEFDSIEDTPQTGSVHRGKMPDEAQLRYMSQHGVNFVADIMGGVGAAPSPYDVGQRLFPSGHPLHDIESEVIKSSRDIHEVVEDAEVIPPKELGEGDDVGK